MKTIIAGCRDFDDYGLLKKHMDEFIQKHQVTEIVSGGARGTDKLGEEYAIEKNIKYTVHEAKWVDNGKAAGPIRNKLMAGYADQLVAVWDGKSKGTYNMIQNMNKLQKPVYVIWIGEIGQAQGEYSVLL